MSTQPHNNIMVCVTMQLTCKRLIEKGKELQKDTGGNIFVVHVAKDGDNFLGNPSEGEAIDYLYNISKDAGAQMTVLRAENLEGAICTFAKENHIGMVVLGSPKDGESSFIDSVKKKIKKAVIEII